ncbi:DUF4857 domain-containing protein [Megalodesulfovibrio paquesii]
MQRLAQAGLALLVVALLAVYLPLGYAWLCVEPVEKTHLLYSPVLEQFVWKEKVAAVPPEALGKDEDHHADIIHRDEAGQYYSRVEFEKLLPFIYFKNMEMWGLLPLSLGGRTFDAASIKSNRRVMELRPRDVLEADAVWRQVVPLLEATPGEARLVFPEDRLRLTPDGLEFINADFNRVDAALSRTFTRALAEAGFVFPARFAANWPVLLKPFDAGLFLVDATGAVFRLRRQANAPVATRLPFPPALQPRHIAVMESNQHDYLGLLLAGNNTLQVLREADLALVELPLPGYDPERMECKLIIDPLHVTAIYSDEEMVHGVAMDRDFRPVRTYSHRMSRAVPSPAQQLQAALFPFQVRWQAEPQPGFQVRPGGALALAGMAAAVVALLVLRRSRRLPLWEGKGLVLTAATGLYGLLATVLVLDE